MSIKAWLLPAEADPIGVECDMSLDALQTFVGGYIEMVYHGAALPEGTALVINENGAELEHNDIASFLYGNCVHGTVLWVGWSGEDFVDNQYEVIEVHLGPPPMPHMHTLN